MHDSSCLANSPADWTRGALMHCGSGCHGEHYDADKLQPIIFVEVGDDAIMALFRLVYYPEGGSTALH